MDWAELKMLLDKKVFFRGLNPRTNKMDSETEHPHKAELLACLKEREVVSAIHGIFRYFFTGEVIRAKNWYFPTACMYGAAMSRITLKKYNMQLPEEFIQHVLNQKKKR